MIRAHIKVSGRVQGVFFRAHTQKQAVRLGLTGWVKNLADEGVEILAEGERAKIESFINAVKQGPPLAHVEKAEVIWLDYRGDLNEFKITW